ncbi:hypothetical protein GCM10009839_81750 [Catenulispora yoronensis]|uniref:Uncharacterized protein n=1 Tax=Catenulispora yoronensis TaxID=450799 RepID=A0ABN2VCI6_9ACTN
MAARVLALDSVARTVYDAENFRVLVFRTPADDSPGVITLDMVFQETRNASAAARRAAVGRLVEVAALPPTPDTWELARPLLRPVLRPPVHDPEIDVVRRPALRYLAEMLVLDSPSAMKYVAPQDLAAWGVDAQQAFDAGHRNLARSVTETLDRARARARAAAETTGRATGKTAGKTTGKPVGKPVGKPADQTAEPEATRLDDSGDFYVTSLPLVEGWLGALRQIAGARPLVFPTSNSVLLLAYESADADRTTARLRDAEREWTESARPLCPAPITVDDDGAATLYEVPADHPAHAAVKHAAILLAMSSYGPQTEYLRDVAASGDPFPASLKGFRSPAGEEFTGTTWSDGIDSLLPHADLVFFPKEGQAMVQIPWDVVAEEVDLTPAEGFHPARYRVGSWPAPEVMARMAARAGGALV